MAFATTGKAILTATARSDDNSLRERGEWLRRLGEVAVVVGLMLVMLWEDATKISPMIANFRGYIHLPAEIVAYFNPDPSVLRKLRLPWPGQIRDVSAVVELIIFLSALSTVVRRRFMAAQCHLVFFLFPWALLGIDMGVAEFGAVGILVLLLIKAATRRDRQKIALWCACIVATIVWFQTIDTMKPVFDDPVYMALPKDGKAPIVDILAGSSEAARAPQNLPISVSAGLAYVAAQEDILRENPAIDLRSVAEAEAYYEDPSSIEAHRLRAVRNALSVRKLGTEDQIAQSKVRIGANVLKTRILLAAAALALVGGIVLQMLSGWIGERSKRILRLTGQLDEQAGLSKRHALAGYDVPNASLDFSAGILALLKRRTEITLFAGIGGLLLGITLLLICWMFWVPNIDDNTAFATIHVLEDFAALNTPAISHDAWLRLRDQNLSLWTMAAPTLVFLAGLVLLVLRQYRKLVFVCAAYSAWCLYGILAPTTGGLVEMLASEFRIEESVMAGTSGEGAASAPAERKRNDSINYTLSQTAYLRNDLVETEKRLSALVTSDFRKMNAFEWRYVAMSDWVSHKRGTPMVTSRLRPNFALSETLSSVSIIAATVAGLFAFASLTLSAMLFLRLRRVDEFLRDISIRTALQRSKNSL
jgi:hypothetical protein